MKFLQSNAFIDPRMLNSLPSEGKVLENGKVEVAGDQLKFDDSASPYPPGTEVMVYVDRNFYYISLQEIEQKRKALQKQQEINEVQHVERERLCLKSALAFNMNLNIPVNWAPANKMVLSGLLEDSWGDGQRSNSVYHVYLLEPLKTGRLERKKYNFLCTTDSGRFGTFIENKEEAYIHEVTCKTCLKIAKRSIQSPTK